MYKIIHSNCFDIMKEMVENKSLTFDMIFLDPPYFDWGTGHKKPDHNILSYYVSRLLKPNGVVFLCGVIPQLIDDLKYWERWFRVLFDIIQIKSAGSIPHSSLLYPRRVHENIWCMAKQEINATNLKLDLKRTIKKTPKEKKRPINSYRILHRSTNEAYDNVNYMKSVYYNKTINQGPEYFGHPTQKPLDLMMEIIKLSTEEGDWVLDPFAGSGTTGAACELLKRNCVMIEIDENFINIIKKRMHLINFNLDFFNKKQDGEEHE